MGALGAFAGSANAAEFTVLNTNAAGAGSLSQAITDANLAVGADTIVFGPDFTEAKTITLTAALPPIISPVTITGPGSTLLTIDGGGTASAFTVAAETTLKGMKVTKTKGVTGPGVNDPTGATLTLDTMDFDTNAATTAGGAVNMGAGSLTIKATTMENNTAVTTGGAINQVGGTLAISDTSLSKSTATGSGGGINMVGGSLTFSSGAVVDGTSGANGGGINMTGGTMLINRSVADAEADPVEYNSPPTITGNTAAVQGGGVFDGNNNLTIDWADIAANKATIGPGGNMYVTGSAPKSIFGADLSDGVSNLTGGGLYANSTSPLLIDSSYVSNSRSKTEGGGGISIAATTPVTLTNSTLTDNVSSTDGGAGMLSLSPNTVINSSTIVNNLIQFAPTNKSFWGAGFEQTGGGTAVVTNSLLSGNDPVDMGTTGGASINTSFDLIRELGQVNQTQTVAGSNIYSVDPQIGKPGDAGGPTQTIAPARTSAVINKGSTALTTDARLNPRPVIFTGVPLSSAAGANGADIGAVELPNSDAPAVPNNKWKFGKFKLNKKKGTGSLKVILPIQKKVAVPNVDPLDQPVIGVFELFRSKVVVSSVQTYLNVDRNGGQDPILFKKLHVKARGKALKKLKKKGKAKIKVKVTFYPEGGTPRTKTKKLTLKKLTKKQLKQQKKNKKK